eukprot:GHVT01074168.1.p1 GENE.GHVT01074168.1~~GHVT01074168.1.p1  ORF type:complete len:254 (+),score=52.41 GHVT01074168.1:44-763(+)
MRYTSGISAAAGDVTPFTAPQSCHPPAAPPSYTPSPALARPPGGLAALASTTPGFRWCPLPPAGGGAHNSNSNSNSNSTSSGAAASSSPHGSVALSDIGRSSVSPAVSGSSAGSAGSFASSSTRAPQSAPPRSPSYSTSVSRQLYRHSLAPCPPTLSHSSGAPTATPASGAANSRGVDDSKDDHVPRPFLPSSGAVDANKLLQIESWENLEAEEHQLREEDTHHVIGKNQKKNSHSQLN